MSMNLIAVTDIKRGNGYKWDSRERCTKHLAIL